MYPFVLALVAGRNPYLTDVVVFGVEILAHGGEKVRPVLQAAPHN